MEAHRPELEEGWQNRQFSEQYKTNAIMKKSGIELIALERAEQIEKHKRTIESDSINNKYHQLSNAASKIIKFDSERFYEYTPHGWNRDQFQKIMRKSYKNRLIIAGALIAAEIDRIQHSEED